jgi:Holliday junction resolvase RusA-like endonuclease
VLAQDPGTRRRSRPERWGQVEGLAGTAREMNGWEQSLDIRLHIAGQPPRKSNSRRIVTNRRTGKPMVIKSQGARDWAGDAAKQIPASARQRVGSVERPLAITFWVRYASRRPDLSVELILDLLEKAEVISNDRHVYEFHAYKEFDKDNPGVEILIQEAHLD